MTNPTAESYEGALLRAARSDDRVVPVSDQDAAALVRGIVDAFTQKGRKVKTSSIRGFMLLYMVSSMKPLRSRTLRWAAVEAAHAAWRTSATFESVSFATRARFALKSMKTPPSSWNGLEKVFMGTGPSPIVSRNHFLSGLRLVKLTFRCRGASTASANSGGGVA